MKLGDRKASPEDPEITLMVMLLLPVTKVPEAIYDVVSSENRAERHDLRILTV